VQGNNAAKDFVTAYDTVNFIDGEGTSVSVENTDNKTSKIKYSVNLGDGLEKTNDNKIKAKAGNGVTVDADGIKVNTGKGLKIDTADGNKVAVNTDGTTITVDNDGKVKAETGSTEVVTADNKTGTEKAGQVRPVATDKDKLATVDTVAQAVNSAKWIAKATNTDAEIADNEKTDDSTKAGEGIAAGDEVTFTAGKNLRVKRDGKNFTYSLNPVLTDMTSIGGNGTTMTFNPQGVDLGNKKITGVKSALDTTPVTTTPGTPVTDQPNLVNLGTKPGEKALPNNVLNSAATVRDLANMGWIVSSNKTTDALGEAYKDTVKNANEVKFIGTGAATVSGKTVDGIRTITVDVKQPEPQTETLTSTGGKVTNPKDDNAKKLVTVGNVADMINKSGFNLKTSADKNSNGEKAKGTKDAGELINPGATVEMVAGKNMSVKQDADGKVTYATKEDVEFNTVKVGNNKDGKSPVEFKTEAAKPATNNAAEKQPTTALNVTSSDGKPTQITGVASSLNTKPVETAPNGKDGAKPESNLVDLANATTPNAAATVGDLQNMGWIVGAPENGYVDTVKNANKVNFKAGAGISVTGDTKDGVREITIGIKDGEVVKPNEDPSSPNTGAGYVTGNKVATAIQKSGFVIGKQTAALASEDFKNEDEKVNPDDQVRFADGNNTKVKLATKESVNNDGTKVTTTTVKVDVTGLPVQYTDKNGTPVTKVGDKYFTVDDKGNPTTTEVKPADLTTNMVNPAAAPNEIGAPTTLGNVKSNLPETKNGNNPTLNQAAPTAEDADKVKNNAATVSDMLNAGWNLQNNGDAKDFVKPYDTVNFVDGKGTKVSVETENGTTSNVKFDIDTGKITNKSDGSVQGPVTPEMQRVLKDAKDAYNSLPPNAPEAVRKVAKQAVEDAENNIANVENKVATAQDVANAINNSGFTLTTSENGGKKISGTPEMINPGKKVEMVAGKNMTVKQESNGKVTYATASNVTFDSVQFGDNGPKITGNINVGTATGAPTKITGVAPGEISATSKDAVNGSQLYAMGNKLQGQINKLGKRMNAGVAGAMAAANLMQPHKPGQSAAMAAIGQHHGEAAVAVGYSRISDNGKYGVKLSVGANTQGQLSTGAGVSYFW